MLYRTSLILTSKFYSIMWTHINTIICVCVCGSPPPLSPAPVHPDTSEPPPAEHLWATHKTSLWWYSWRSLGTEGGGSCWQMTETVCTEFISYLLIRDLQDCPVDKHSNYIWNSTDALSWLWRSIMKQYTWTTLQRHLNRHWFHRECIYSCWDLSLSWKTFYSWVRQTPLQV